MSGVAHKDVLLSLRPLVVDGLNEIGELAVKEAAGINPILGTVTGAVVDALCTVVLLGFSETIILLW